MPQSSKPIVSPEAARQELRTRLQERARRSDYVAYRHDPIGFIEGILGEFVWRKQREIILSVRDNPATAVPSCFASGKSWTAGRVIAWWVTTGGVAIVTSDTFRQVRDIVWREVREAHAKGGLPGHIPAVECRWETGRKQAWAIGVKPDDTNREGFQGIHADRVLTVYDEANGIPDALFEAGLGLTTGPDDRRLAIGNPHEPVGPFFDACRSATWNVIPISAYDTPNFTGEWIPTGVKLIYPGWVDERRAEGLEGTPFWQSKVLGQFPDTASNAIIPLAWVEAARARPHVPDAREWAGLDVARYGSDDTVLVTGSGNGFEEIEVVHGQGTMETAGMGIRYLNARRGSLAVDVIGVGSGVVDRIKEQRPPGQLLAVNVGENADREPELLQNLRAQVWWDMRRALDPATDDGLSLARLPEQTYQRLRSELTAPTYRFTSSGKVQIESKEELAKRGVSSPDVADAACLALYARSRARRRVTFGAAA